MRNQFRRQIYDCECDRCQALESLVEDSGARLVFSPDMAGRLCELAVVAATGNAGLHESGVVEARREYAKHLGITLSGPVSDADIPNHIQHAIENSNHNPDAVSRINLGRAKASFRDGRYRLT